MAGEQGWAGSREQVRGSTFRGGAGAGCLHPHHPLLPRYSNLDLQSQEAYEMAVRGVIRPMNKSPMLITGIRCLHFAPPEFLLGKLSQEVGAPGLGVTVEYSGRSLTLGSAKASTRQP